ncbi:MAG: glycerophosphodiester phosphodiesterase [Sphingomicrobium sp.]
MRGCFLFVLAAATPASAAPPQPVAIVAHRGLAKGVPENTIAAFRQSVARGIAVIELDVRKTRDGHLVILHDPTLDRTTDCSGRIAELSLARIKACDAGWRTHGGERVPTLAEALAFIKPTPARLLLDIKPGTPLESVIREVRASGAAAKMIFGLRSAKDVARTRAELPEAATLAFIPGAGDAPAFTHAGAHIIRLWSDWVEADPAVVSRTRALGPDVWIMVGRGLPSKPAGWRALHRRMIATGAQGLITDRPDLISGP